MLSTSTFSTMIEEFSKHVHRNYFNSISPSDWLLLNRGPQYIEFGYQAGKYFGYNSNPPHRITFNISYADGVLSIYSGRELPQDKKHFKNILNDFLTILEKYQIDMLINCSHGFTKSLVKRSKTSYFATGEKSKELLEILEVFTESEDFYLNSWSQIALYSKSYANRKYFYLKPVLEENPYFSVSAYRDDKYSTNISSKEEVKEFLDSFKKDSEELRSKEQEIVEMIKKVDITCYYNRENGSLYIYNERVPFHIAKIEEKGKMKYRIRFNSSYNKGSDLDSVLEKVKTKVNAYVKKSRVKAAVGGNAFDVFHKFLYRVLGYQVNRFSFKKYFDTSLSEGDLNKKLRTLINDDLIVLNDDYKNYFQFYIRQKGNRHQIKKALKLGDLFTFVSSSKLFVVTEEEFNNIELNELSFSQKKDRILVKQLEEWKEKSLV